MSSKGYSVVPVGRGAFMGLRIVQIILSVIILAMAAYNESATGGLFIFTPAALGIFTCIATWILAAYWFFANGASGQKFYNYWAIFATECFVWLFWLITFALYASAVTGALAFSSSVHVSTPKGGGGGGSPYSPSDPGCTVTSTRVCCYGTCYSYKRDLGLSKRFDALGEAAAAAATVYGACALAVINWILFSVSLTLYTIAMFKHRKTLATAEDVQQPQAEMHPIPAHKVEMA